MTGVLSETVTGYPSRARGSTRCALGGVRVAHLFFCLCFFFFFCIFVLFLVPHAACFSGLCILDAFLIALSVLTE